MDELRRVLDIDAAAKLPPVMVWRKAIATSNLEASRRHVLHALSDHMKVDGTEAFPTVKTLAGETGLGERTVRRAIRAAEDAGWLDVEQSGGYSPSLYEATVPARIFKKQNPATSDTLAHIRTNLHAREHGHHGRDNPAISDMNPATVAPRRGPKEVREKVLVSDEFENRSIEDKDQGAAAIARGLARKPKRKRPMCEWCGEVEVKRSQSRYCSRGCGSRAHQSGHISRADSVVTHATNTLSSLAEGLRSVVAASLSEGLWEEMREAQQEFNAAVNRQETLG